MFGEGNVETTVLMFETKHKCNRFCEWPNFGLKQYGHKEDDKAHMTGTSVEYGTS